MAQRDPSDSRWFRDVMGQYPTGVCVVTALEEDGSRAGFVVGSFTSVSLEPPLVAFFPTKTSTSWPRIQSAGKFCINILSHEQEHLCRQFAAKGGDKFAGLTTRPASSGSPIISDVVAWIDCDLDGVYEAGDHYIVLGRVRELDVESSTLPLLFFQGGYGRFSPLSLVAAYSAGTSSDRLRQVDRVRPAMEALAEELGGQCLVTSVVDGELIVQASAGNPESSSVLSTLVGVHLPYALPNNNTFVAWQDEPAIAKALAELPEGDRDTARTALERVRSRGYSIGLLNDAQREFAGALNRLAVDPTAVGSGDLHPIVTQQSWDPEEITDEVRSDIRVIAVPVFDENGSVPLALTLYGFARPDTHGGIDAYIDRVVQAGHRATELIGGKVPALDPAS